MSRNLFNWFASMAMNVPILVMQIYGLPFGAALLLAGAVGLTWGTMEARRSSQRP